MPNTSPDKSATSLPLEDNIRTVIDCLIDGQRGLRKIGDLLQDPTIKQYFLEESLVRAEFRGILEYILHHQGVHDIEESGSLSSTMNHAWGRLKSKLGGGDQSLLEVAEHDQLAATKAYAKALEQQVPFPVRQTLLAQAARIELFHEYVQAVRKINKALASD
jgi:uncharacterized protein (TIGR02284 family)